MKNILFTLICLVFLVACGTVKEASIYHFPNPVDTTTRPIEMQEKKTYVSEGVYADNQFDAARLNDFAFSDNGRYMATILPENEPINHSPWYAFRLWSEDEKEIEKAVKQLLKSCIQSRIKIEELPIFDLEYMASRLDASKNILTIDDVTSQTKNLMSQNAKHLYTNRRTF